MTRLAKIQPQRIAVNLFELLSQTELIEESEREMWLANFDDLLAHEQKELAQILLDSERELEKENENYLARVAEVNAKYATKLKHFTADKKKLLFRETSFSAKTKDQTADDELEEELLAQLEQFGER